MLKSFTPVVVMVFLFLFDIEVPYQHTLSTHLTNQHTLSTYPINTSYQHTLSTHPINTPYQHTLSTHSINTPCQHTLSNIHPTNTDPQYPAASTARHQQRVSQQSQGVAPLSSYWKCPYGCWLRIWVIQYKPNEKNNTTQ